MKTNLLLSLLLLASASTAGAMISDNASPFYLRAEGGASWSRKADICTDSNFWDTAKEGYDNDLGNTAVVGFGFGVNLNEWLSLGVSTNYRGIFEYCQKQTGAETQEAANNLGNKTRFFDFDSTSYMFDVFLNRTGCDSYYSYDFMDCHSIAPYLGAGIGFAVNELWNFHTVRDTTFTTASGSTPQNIVGSIMTLKKDLQFAWQVAFGFEWSYTDCGSFAVGYRYFGAGDLPFNNYNTGNLPENFIPSTSPTYDPTTVTTYVQTQLPAWDGKFRTNELVVSFTLFF